MERARDDEAEDWWTLAEESREIVRRHLNGRPMPSVDDLFHDMREERDAQLLANVGRPSSRPSRRRRTDTGGQVMGRTVTDTEAGQRFGDLLREVVDSDATIFVEHDGERKAVVLPFAEYERLHHVSPKPEDVPQVEDWWALVEQSRERVRRELNGRALTPIEDVIHEMREERDEQILGNLRRR